MCIVLVSAAIPSDCCMHVQIPPFGGNYTCTGKCAEQVYDKMFKTAAGNAITACLGTVPGYWFTVAFIDTIGRVRIQYMGEAPFLTCVWFWYFAHADWHDAHKKRLHYATFS